MPQELQRDINVTLLRCIIDSHKAMVSFVNYSLSNKDDAETARATYEALSEKMTTALDRCADLIEKADQ